MMFQEMDGLLGYRVSLYIKKGGVEWLFFLDIDQQPQNPNSFSIHTHNSSKESKNYPL
jgi:hypothetical protein